MTPLHLTTPGTRTAYESRTPQRLRFSLAQKSTALPPEIKHQAPVERLFHPNLRRQLSPPLVTLLFEPCRPCAQNALTTHHPEGKSMFKTTFVSGKVGESPSVARAWGRPNDKVRAFWVPGPWLHAAPAIQGRVPKNTSFFRTSMIESPNLHETWARRSS